MPLDLLAPYRFRAAPFPVLGLKATKDRIGRLRSAGIGVCEPAPNGGVQGRDARLPRLA